jgi:hypothetical protein
VKGIALHNMVFLSKDYNLDAYIFSCPILNAEARCKLEHMGLEVPNQCECERRKNAARIQTLAGYIV